MDASYLETRLSKVAPVICTMSPVPFDKVSAGFVPSHCVLLLSFVRLASCSCLHVKFSKFFNFNAFVNRGFPILFNSRLMIHPRPKASWV